MNIHRKRRIAADEAHSWARNLRLKNPYAKLVLGMLTLYVDGAGACFVGIEALAEDTELSTDTVRKRLAWLEGVGAIARFPQWIDGNGRRNGDGNGKRTSDEIRLLTSADTDMIEARAAGDEVAESDAATSEISPRSQQGLNPGPETVSPLVALGQPSDCSKGLTSEPEPEDSPQAPLRGDVQVPSASQESEPIEVEGWEEFKTEFEGDGVPIARPSIAKTLFAALTLDERKIATKAARGLVAHRRREKKPGAKQSAQTFIRETEGWAGYVKLAPAEPVTKTEYARGAPEFQALAVFRMLVHRTPIEGDRIAGPASISPQFRALSRFGVDRQHWFDLDAEAEKHKHQIAAWRGFVKDRTGMWIEPELVPVIGEDGKQKIKIQEWNGKTLEFPEKRRVLKVPCEWPPRKDGSTGPPSDQSAA